MPRTAKQIVDEINNNPRLIVCPGCARALRLEGFGITHHSDGTWTADPSIICSWEGCKAHFFVTRSNVEWCAGQEGAET
jgi:hypothetical protein